ncbi:hypothetical protein [Loktanella sp. S4079]|uniref:hypothetical protein n=1 Tax=Loktanella sp. S4079 TaxID=579483 RepID=UPI0005FA778A|nr:hypothetical protein [Loktanella sp. S4079]KJZ19429.1 hypothetical protein TW80_11770 [Loktanella sp. S4079]
MSDEKTVTFYLSPQMRRQAERGNHNFIRQICRVVEEAGFSIAYDVNDHLGRLNAMSRAGRSLFLMDDPVDDRGLTFRRTYIFPFWHIEKQSERWEWPVAKQMFDPIAQDPVKARGFHRRWQEKLFPNEITQSGFVLVPLQGRLTTCRSFQHCSPLDMVKATLRHDKTRDIVVTLHPSETYTDDEMKALHALIDANDRLTLQHQRSEKFLFDCDYVVTQNSSLGFLGYFLRKPLILFGKTDFHHIALKVDELGVSGAFSALPDHTPDYESYLFWFLQKQSINAGRPEVQSVIQNVLKGHGWPV